MKDGIIPDVVKASVFANESGTPFMMSDSMAPLRRSSYWMLWVLV